jgi:arsenate reductase
MAEGLLRDINSRHYEAFSAGVKPTALNPKAIQVMREIGIDISKQLSKSVDQFSDSDFDIVVTVCDNAKESCPVFGAASIRIHWGFVDPAAATGADEQVMGVFRVVRDRIKKRIETEFADA